MIKLNQAVIVEGKYDKITLENVIDATIITTNGFRIFKDKEKREFIRLLAVKKGLIIMTDSDSAGALIRSHLKQICPDGTITNVYVPQLVGKEKRKTKPAKEGFLGVEGLDKQIILHALERSGVTQSDNGEQKPKVTKTHFFELGLSGTENSAALRDGLAENLNLPTGLSCNAFLDCINAVCDHDDFIKAVEQWQKNRQEGDKR